MDSVFGIPITTLLIIVLAGMAACLVSTALVAWRNAVVFRMAVRNVPRRRAQSVLIMVGLMLSTLIITAALSTGDTLDSSLTGGAYDSLGHVDETIAFADPGGESDLSVTNPTFPASIANELQAQLGDDVEIDGIMPLLTVAAPAISAASALASRLSSSRGWTPALSMALARCGLRTGRPSTSAPYRPAPPSSPTGWPTASGFGPAIASPSTTMAGRIR